MAVVDGDDPSFVLSDGAEKIYLIATDGNGAFLAAIQEAPVGVTALATRLAALGDRVFGGSADGRLIGFTLPALEPAERIELGGSVGWGPYTVGDLVVVASEAGRLIAVGTDGKVAWEQTLTDINFAGPPLAGDGELVLAFQSGRVTSISMTDGQPTGSTNVGEPLVGGAQMLEGMLVVATQDGSILVINKARLTNE